VSSRPRLGWGIPEALTEESLSETARAQHRNVLLVGSAAILVVWLDLVPREISAIGVRLEADDRRSVLIALLLALVYFFTAFLVYGATDFVAWLRVQTEGRELLRGTAQDRQRHRATYEEILRQHEGGNPEQRQETVSRLDETLRDANTAALRHQTVRVIVPLALVRGTIDFFVPTVVALTGIVWLSVEIW